MIVQSKFTGMYKIAGEHFVAPGQNHIADDVAIKLVETKDFKEKVASGKLIVSHPPTKAGAEKVAAAKAAGQQVSPVGALSADKAKDTIDGMQDVNQLKAIVEFDSRPGIKKHAQAKMDFIRKAMEKDEADAKNKAGGKDPE